MSKNTYRTKLLQYDQHWELLHQTPMKKCPECHSKRPIGESSSESEEDVTTSSPKSPKQ